jgi:hypothetical protein
MAVVAFRAYIFPAELHPVPTYFIFGIFSGPFSCILCLHISGKPASCAYISEDPVASRTYNFRCADSPTRDFV